jgi:hypothetical protein
MCNRRKMHSRLPRVRPVFGTQLIVAILTGNKPQPEILLPNCYQFRVCNHSFSFALVRNLPRENHFRLGTKSVLQTAVLGIPAPPSRVTLVPSSAAEFAKALSYASRLQLTACSIKESSQRHRRRRSEMFLKLKIPVQLKACMDRSRQTGKEREKVLGKSPKLPLHLHKSLIFKLGAGNENRTRIASLEGWSFTIKLCPRKSCH